MDMSEHPGLKKITVVGDDGIGKTSFLMKFVTDKNPFEEQIPQTSNIFEKDIIDDYNQHCILRIYDTDREFLKERYSEILFASRDVILLCFSLDSRESFLNLTKKYISLCQRTVSKNIILVGTKSDLRQKRNPNHISDSEAKKFALEHKFSNYISCSTKDNIGFDKIYSAILKLIKPRRTHNYLLPLMYGYFYLSMFTWVIPLIHYAIISSQISNLKETNLYNITKNVEYVSIAIILFGLFTIFLSHFSEDRELLNIICYISIPIFCLIAIAQIVIGIKMINLANNSSYCENNKCKFIKRFTIDLLVNSVLYALSALPPTGYFIQGLKWDLFHRK